MSNNKDIPESNSKQRFNLNMVGLALLVVAYLASLFDVLHSDDAQPQPDNEGGQERVVRLLHWQLEPGFREALDAVIEDYNALPHVREKGYRVKQMAVTERVYSQFLNVHLISGTAPDLSALGQSKMANNRAQFFEPFLEVLDRPNPYAADRYLPDDLNPELKKFLQTSPWKETCLNGLQASLDKDLGYYYSIPIASWGTVRMFLNKSLLADVKDVLRAAFSEPVMPDWLDTVLDDAPDQTPGAFLPDTPELRAWVSTHAAPRTFGQLILLCEAARVYATTNGNDKLVPISGSSYSRDLFADGYNATFFYDWEDRIDLDLNGSYSNIEWYAGYDQGRWSFDEPRMRAFYELQIKLATYFPAGFLGLDREQANRRFILGNALFLVTGAWDAAGIFKGASERVNEIERFEVGIIDLPLPEANERWGSLDPEPATEVGSMNGVPLGLYKFSRNKEEAIDFLQYVTSLEPNRKLVQKAGWLPIVVGSEPNERMKPFLPVVKGVRDSLRHNIDGGNVGTIYGGQYLLLISGDIDYPTFVEQVTAAFTDPGNGIDRQWYESFRRARDNIRGIERSLSVQRFNQLRQDNLEMDLNRYRQVLDRSSSGISGLIIRKQWREFGYERPFPEY
jgi:ABC-type glycerol-3-phosphate transport system substrate-binding protein